MTDDLIGHPHGVEPSASALNDAPVDVVVIGGGAGGLTAAGYAAQQGASVVLVSDGPLGGDCTHTGCVPSKTLLAAAAAGQPFSEAMARVRATVDRIAATENAEVLARRGMTVLKGRAELVAPGEVRVEHRLVTARQIILATGATAALPPIRGLDGVGALTNATVFGLEARPGSLAVVGGGSIGCEMAQAFARSGTAVTVIEAADRLLPAEDPEVSDVLATALRDDGVTIHTGTRLDEASRVGERRHLRLDGGLGIDVDEVLVAAGRRPVTDGLGLDRLGVELDPSGHVVVDSTCATNVPGVWAVGDVTPLGGFTHVAGHMGHVAATNALRRKRLRPAAKIDRRVVPRVTYTDPEVAGVGILERDAPRGARVAEVRLDRIDRAITSGQELGFVKLIAGPRRVIGDLGGGQILGATIVAPRAGEMIAEVALAMRTRAFTGRLAQTIHAYPTWSMAVQQAALGFFFDRDDVTVRSVRT